MKIASVMVVAALGLLAVTANAQQTAPQTDTEKRSYAIGVQVAEGIKGQGLEVNPAMVAAGMRDALAGAKLQMTDDEIGAALFRLFDDDVGNRMTDRFAEHGLTLDRLFHGLLPCLGQNFLALASQSGNELIDI